MAEHYLQIMKKKAWIYFNNYVLQTAPNTYGGKNPFVFIKQLIT